MRLSNTNIRKLQVIVGRLGLQEVEQMAHISRTCLNNALSGSRLQTAPPEDAEPCQPPDAEHSDGLLTVVSHGNAAQLAALRAIIEAAVSGLGMPVAFE